MSGSVNFPCLTNCQSTPVAWCKKTHPELNSFTSNIPQNSNLPCKSFRKIPLHFVLPDPATEETAKKKNQAMTELIKGMFAKIRVVIAVTVVVVVLTAILVDVVVVFVVVVVVVVVVAVVVVVVVDHDVVVVDVVVVFLLLLLLLKVQYAAKQDVQERLINDTLQLSYTVNKLASSQVLHSFGDVLRKAEQLLLRLFAEMEDKTHSLMSISLVLSKEAN